MKSRKYIFCGNILDFQYKYFKDNFRVSKKFTKNILMIIENNSGLSFSKCADITENMNL